MRKVDLAEKFSLITEHWRPKVVGELNGQEVKLVKFLGAFVWHQSRRWHTTKLAVRQATRLL